MAAAQKSFLCFFFLFVLFYAVFLLPHLVTCNDDEDNLLQGINSYRTSLRLPILTKNKKAACLADEIAEKLEDQPCTNAAGVITSPQLASNYDSQLKKCGIDINTTREGVVLPVCVHKLVPTLVLTNYTRSSYAQYLNNSKFTGAGLGSEDDWMVVVLSTNTVGGTFESGARRAVGSKNIEWSCCMVCLLLGLLVHLVY